MPDVLCILMGLIDITAGIILIVLVFSPVFILILGILLILKGMMSFMDFISF